MQKNLRYSITLNDAQLDYLSDEQQEIHRMKCFKTFLQMTIPEENKVYGKNYSAVLQPGQFVASKVDLARLWGCDRKTATRIVHEFNQLGILRSESSNRTTIHTMICLSAWFTGRGMLRSSFFDRNQWSSLSWNRPGPRSVSHLKLLSKTADPTVQIRRIQVGHSRTFPASFSFPFIPN